jgi:hypothetical protein
LIGSSHNAVILVARVKRSETRDLAPRIALRSIRATVLNAFSSRINGADALRPCAGVPDAVLPSDRSRSAVALSAVDVDAGLSQCRLLDRNADTFFLRERADAADMIAGQPFGVGGMYHLRGLAAERGGEFLMWNPAFSAG